MASWTTLRKQVLKRDNHTCQECGGKEGKLHAHHKHQRWQGGKDEADNLITLCQPCHATLHGEEDRQYFEQRRKADDEYNVAYIAARAQCYKEFSAQGGDDYDEDAWPEFCRAWQGWPIKPD